MKLSVSLTRSFETSCRCIRSYSEAFWESVTTEQLISHMLDQFLSKDKAFRAALRKKVREDGDSTSLEISPHYCRDSRIS